MGAFYGSIHVRSGDPGAVGGVLERLATRDRKFLLAPAINGWVSVYPTVYGQDSRVSKAIAKKLADPILHVAVHDDDIFYYWYYRDGKLVDRFCSCPDYFGPVSKRKKSLLQGKPGRLEELLGRPTEMQKLENLLDKLRSQPPFVSEGLEEFAELFRLPNALTGYEDLMAGETESIEEWDQFVHVPDLTEERKQEQEAAARVQRDKDRLRDEGALLREVTLGRAAFRWLCRFPWCADPVNGLVSAAPDMVSPQELPLERLLPPWTGEASSIGIAVSSQSQAITTSQSGHMLAVGCGIQDQKAEAWDLRRRELKLEIEHTSGVCSLAFTPDESILFSLSFNEIVGTDIETGERIVEYKVDEGQSIDLHPSGNLVALKKPNSASIVNLKSGQEMLIRLGHYQDLSGLRQLLQDELAKEMEGSGPDCILQKVRQTTEQLEVSEDSPAGKRIHEETEQGLSEILSGNAFAHMGERSFQPEDCFSVIFAGNGKFLCCVTTRGLRVFETASLLEEGEGEVMPVIFVEPTSVPMEHGEMPAFFYALADDPENGRLIYGGMEGMIRCIDLTTFEQRDLFAIPGSPAIIQMQLVSRSLLCMCQPDFPETRGKPKPPSIQIWNLDALTK